MVGAVVDAFEFVAVEFGAQGKVGDAFVGWSSFIVVVYAEESVWIEDFFVFYHLSFGKDNPGMLGVEEGVNDEFVSIGIFCRDGTHFPQVVSDTAYEEVAGGEGPDFFSGVFVE